MSEMSYMYMQLQEFDKEISKVTAIRTRKSIILKREPTVPEEEDSSGEDDEKDHDNLKLQNVQLYSI